MATRPGVACAALALLAACAPVPARAPGDIPPGNPTRGETLFWAGGCESCHAAPDATGDDLLKLGGGATLDTPFGVFSVTTSSSNRMRGPRP